MIVLCNLGVICEFPNIPCLLVLVFFMPNLAIVPVILSGGSGTRLWPMSRSARPKQFVQVDPDQGSFFQQALRRLKPPADLDIRVEPAIIVGSAQHSLLFKAQADEVDAPIQAILAEPARRDTCAAIASAALYAQRYDRPIQLLVLSSDHIISNPQALWHAIAQAYKAAAKGHHVTFGIRPTSPETRFGYIQTGQTIDHAPGCFAARQFREKPDQKTAEQYIQAGDFYWNAGMFLFDCRTVLEDLKRLQPGIMDACAKALDLAVSTSMGKDLTMHLLDEGAFTAAAGQSIDYALMERSDKVAVVPTALNWQDIGGWSAMYDLSKRDENANSLRGDVFGMDTTNSLLWSDGPVIAAVGLDNFIVVANEDAILISPKDRQEVIKDLVKQLEVAQRQEVDYHVERIRQWGSWRVVTKGQGYEVRKVHLNAGGQMGLQSHQHRTESWTVVSGQLTITIDGAQTQLDQGNSLSIPPQSVHQVTNMTSKNVVAIELITGKHIEADDVQKH